MIEREHKGVKYKTIECGEVIGTCTTEDRIKIKGTLSLSNSSNSWKYGKEFIITVYSKEFKKDERAIKSDWNRIEIYLNNEQKKQLLEVLQNG